MALSPDDKFIYINPDTTSGEYNTALYLPVRYLRGLECAGADNFYIYFRGPQDANSTRITVFITSGYIKEVFTQFVDEVNFGEASVITLADRNISVDATTGGTDFTHVNAYTPPVIVSESATLGAEDVQVAEDLDVGGDLDVDGVVTGKQKQVFVANFYDNLDTNIHYLPFKDINEQTYIYQDEVAMLAPCDGRIASVTLRPHSLTGAGNITVGVHTLPPNDNIYSGGNWNSEETETLAVDGADDHHVFHFVFDNAKHFESTETVVCSMQADADVAGNSFWYVTIVVEYDWNTFITSSGEHASAP